MLLWNTVINKFPPSYVIIFIAGTIGRSAATLHQRAVCRNLVPTAGFANWCVDSKATSNCKKSWDTVVCSAYFEDNMVFNKSLPPPRYQSCTRSKMVFTPTVINFARGKGGQQHIALILFACVMPSFLYGRSIFLKCLNLIATACSTTLHVSIYEHH